MICRILMIARAIKREIEELLLDHGLRRDHLTEDTPLANSGLDLMLLAVLITRLEDSSGLDPFSTLDEFEVPATLGDFIRLYQNAALRITKPAG